MARKPKKQRGWQIAAHRAGAAVGEYIDVEPTGLADAGYGPKTK
jgi:hypothetical protein